MEVIVVRRYIYGAIQFISTSRTWPLSRSLDGSQAFAVEVHGAVKKPFLNEDHLLHWNDAKVCQMLALMQTRLLGFPWQFGGGLLQTCWLNDAALKRAPSWLYFTDVERGQRKHVEMAADIGLIYSLPIQMPCACCIFSGSCQPRPTGSTTTRVTGAGKGLDAGLRLIAQVGRTQIRGMLCPFCRSVCLAGGRRTFVGTCFLFVYFDY